MEKGGEEENVCKPETSTVAQGKGAEDLRWGERVNKRMDTRKTQNRNFWTWWYTTKVPALKDGV